VSEGSGSGTEVGGLTGPTLAALRARCRLLLASTADWPDASLDAWIGDAIRFYSNEFPRLIRHPLTLVTGTQSYALPAGCVGVVLVEYPAGDGVHRPPRLVARVTEDSAAFQAGGAVYAVRGVAEDETNRSAVIFAETVATGETAIVSYSGAHWIPTADDESTSVPELHTEALIAFVDFRAHAQLESAEAVNLGNVSIILAQLGQEARLAWRRYKEVVERLQEKTPAPSGRVVWGRIGL